MASSEIESIELEETVVKLSDNGSQIGSEAVPETGNTALSPNDVKEWSNDKLENFLDSKISLVEAKGTTCLLLIYVQCTYHNLAFKMNQLLRKISLFLNSV